MMKISLRVGWPLCACACISLALPAIAQVSTAPVAPKYSELSRKIENRGDHTVTLIRVRPTILPKAPAPTPPPEMTADQKTTAERRAKKSYESIAITANVYVGAKTITELSWTEDDVTYRALSNVDFRLLTQLTEIETDDSVFLWFPFVCAAEGEAPIDLTAKELKKLNPNHPDYILLGSPKDRKAAAKGLDLLDYVHAYAQLYDAKLRSDLAAREADELAAEEKRKNAPTPSPVITFWLETGGKQ